MQSISAWAVGSLVDSVRLCALATTSPSMTITAPTGTSPLAAACRNDRRRRPPAYHALSH
eukprot:scaffold158238_cov26-Prasinocladus_malaysianus.AAC.1